MMEKMELCTARGISNCPLIHPKFIPAAKHIQLINCKTQFPSSLKQSCFNSGTGLRYRISSSLRSTTSETSNETTQYDSDEPESDGRIVVEHTRPDEKKDDFDSQLNEAPQEGSWVDSLQLKFLEDFDIKLDYEETYSVLVFGGGGAVALWLAAAIVGAIDSIPVFPKVLELVGLGYTIWFTSRYLLFKENRDELVTRIEQIKQEVFGSKDD